MHTDTNDSTAGAAGPAAQRPSKKPSGNLILALLRLALGVTQRVAPGTAVRMAALLFRTPLPTKRATRGAKVPAGVRIEQVPFEGASVTLYHYPAASDAPRVLLTHGWAGYGLQLANVGAALSAAGWAVILMDQPGHGRSAGWTGNLQQFSRALRFVGARLGPLHALVGHSMGGAAISHAVVEGLAADKLVLISAPVSLTDETRSMGQALRLSERVLAETIAHIEARERVPFDTIAATYLAPRIALPTLVVHDLEDTTVPHGAAQTLVKHLPNPRLHTTSGLGHRRLLKDPGVVGIVADFLGPARG
ncbi:alpha/beta hydrolase [Massilia sp. YMA4]|uniref:alpha/beta hydrolase n=1 Tax=Massilia sp. YMA4 TaxID=1593482 RepID=UPI000DD1036B|nr:alpha/beta fold hydrolase [Massilia sp. YMA4]AXA93806.1 alpha/beta hydrolase [Massilia sp. YMA4]